MFNRFIIEPFKKFLNWAKSIGSSIGNFGSGLVSSAKNTASKVGEKISDNAAWFYNWVRTKVQKVWDKIAYFFTTVMDKMMEFLREIQDFLGSAGGGITGIGKTETTSIAGIARVSNADFEKTEKAVKLKKAELAAYAEKLGSGKIGQKEDLKQILENIYAAGQRKGKSKEDIKTEMARIVKVGSFDTRK